MSEVLHLLLIPVSVLIVLLLFPFILAFFNYYQRYVEWVLE